MLEPQTTAKCIISTTKGRLDVELWCKEIPVVSRKFLEACQLGELEDEAIYQISDDGKMVYLSTNKSDIHSLPIETNERIRFNRSGLLGWDNNLKTWFITLKEYSNENANGKVIAGKIVDGSSYTLKAIVDESETDTTGKLLYPAYVNRTEITIPYFDDLPARVIKKLALDEGLQQKKSTKVKLSYEDEDEDEEEDLVPPLKKIKIKMPKGIKITEEVITPSIEVSAEKNEKIKLAQVTEVVGSQRIEDNKQALRPTLQEYGHTEREQKTLEMLAMFKEKVKGKNILKKNV